MSPVTPDNKGTTHRKRNKAEEVNEQDALTTIPLVMMSPYLSSACLYARRQISLYIFS